MQTNALFFAIYTIGMQTVAFIKSVHQTFACRSVNVPAQASLFQVCSVYKETAFAFKRNDPPTRTVCDVAVPVDAINLPSLEMLRASSL